MHETTSNNNETVIEERGNILSVESDQIIDLHRRTIVEKIAALGSEIEVYSGEHAQNRDNASTLPFHISPEFFKLSPEDQLTIEKSGTAITNYYKATDDLYQRFPADHRWHKWLDHSKPDFILNAGRHSKDSHLFVRPDFILTAEGPIVTEIETSPFGLALSIFLGRAYAAHYPQINSEIALQTIIDAVKDRQPVTFLVTDYTKKYYGQFIYLTKLLSERGIQATVSTPATLPSNVATIYRSFYLHETMNDSRLKKLVTEKAEQLIPPPKAYLEEKALMGMIFDPEFEDYYRQTLGTDFYLLRKIFPPTYVLASNSIPTALPIKSWLDIADLPASQRQYVVKPSGFNPDSSWAKGVEFLHKLSKKACKELIEKILLSSETHVIQSFRKGTKFEQDYFDFKDQKMKTMEGKVRITPYFKVKDGTLITAKATLCPNTDYIHASVASINSPTL